MNWKLAIVVRLLFLGTWKSGHWQSDQREHPDHSVTGASFDGTVSNVMYIIHKKHQKYVDAYSWIMEKRFLPPHQRFECSHWQGFLLNVELEEARGILGMGCQRMGSAPNVEGLGGFRSVGRLKQKWLKTKKWRPNPGFENWESRTPRWQGGDLG